MHASHCGRIRFRICDCMRHISFENAWLYSCVTCHTCDMTHVWHDSCVTWLMCNMTHEWHDSCVTELICDMTHVWHDLCVTQIMRNMHAMGWLQLVGSIKL